MHVLKKMLFVVVLYTFLRFPESFFATIYTNMLLFYLWFCSFDVL